MSAFKKKDRVSFIEKGKTVKGTIYKGGISPTVVIDGTMDTCRAPAKNFTSIDTPYSYPQTDADKRISVKLKTNSVASMEGHGYEFTFFLDGNKIAILTDQGDGGPLDFEEVKGSPSCINEFKQLVESWFDFHFDLPRPMAEYNKCSEMGESNLVTFGDWLVEYSWLPVTPSIAIQASITSMVSCHEDRLKREIERDKESDKQKLSDEAVLNGKPEQIWGSKIEIYLALNAPYRLVKNIETSVVTKVPFTDWNGFMVGLKVLDMQGKAV